MAKGALAGDTKEHKGVAHDTTDALTQNILRRLRNIEGQVRGLQRMVEEDQYCIDILTQIRSASSALARVQENIFRAHLESCVKDSLSGDDPHDREVKVNEILEILSKFR